MKNVITKLTYLLILVLTFISSVFSQRTITGTITDSKGEPLIGATVLVMGTTQGTVTDFDGKYSINIPADVKELVFSYTGFISYRIEIGNDNIINIVLSDAIQLDEDLVSEYGSSSMMNYVESTKIRIKSFYEEGELIALNEFLEERINICERFSDMETCITDLSFAGGYYFQQASKAIDKEEESEYIHLAENYYKQVLSLLPDNKAAQHNLSNLYQLKGLNESSVEWYQKMAEKYPNQKAYYLMKLANLYGNEKGHSVESSNYLWESYSADPYNKDVYRKIIDLYKKEAVFFSKNISLTNFAYRSQKFGFPNFGEELLRHQVVNSFSSQNSDDSDSAIIAWINMLVDNNWITGDKMELFIGNNFKALRTGRSVNNPKQKLEELISLLRNNNNSRLKYWGQLEPKFLINEAGDEVRPVDITIKILYQKGEKALFARDPILAEKYWNDALRLCKSSKNPQYPKIAKDLAKLYYSDKTIDRNGSKLKTLVDNLFDAKGSAYRNGNKDLIRDCHTTLGEIYYNLEKWDGGWATNARFQLERALRDDNETIINPDLKEMLAVTYNHTEQFGLAQRSYHNATMDLLKMDQIDEAKNMLAKATSLNKRVNDDDLSRMSVQLSNLVLFREGNYLPEGKKLVNKEEAQSYINKVNQFQKDLYVSLSKEFVNGQIFKGLTDIGGQLTEASEVQQVIYSTALSNISNNLNLESITDYDRINKIKTTFEKEVDSNQLKKTRLNNKSKITSADLNFYANYKTYQIQGLDIQVQVPIYLFELNNAIIADQKSIRSEKSKYKYDGRKIEKINK